MAVLDLARADVSFTSISVEDGLPAGYVVELAQDRQGFIWIADINAGLIRFDGYEFRSYRHDPNNPTSISSDEIRRLHVDPKGILWVGTGAGLNRYDPKTDSFTRITTASTHPSGLSHDGISCVLVDSAGRLWVGTEKGLNRLDPGAESFRQYHVDRGYAGGFSQPDFFFAALEDSAGRLWFGSAYGGGLLRFDPDSDSLQQYLYDGTSSSPPVIHVRSLAEDHAGTIWIAAESGLSTLNPENMQFERVYFRQAKEDVNTLKFPTTDIAFWSVYEDRQKYVWLGTRGTGAFRISPDRKTWRHFTSSPNDPGSIGGNRVWNPMVDQSGQVWFPTLLKVSRYNPLADGVDYFHVPPEIAKGSSIASIASIAKDEIAVGTSQDGLWILNIESGEWRKVALPALGGMPGIAKVWASSDGGLWVSTTGSRDNLYRLRSDLTFARSFQFPVAPWFFHEDREGNYWFGSPAGLSEMERETGNVKSWAPIEGKADSLGHSTVYSIYRDSRGRVWVGTYRGLDLMEADRESFRHFDPDPMHPTRLPAGSIRDIRESANGDIWFNNGAGTSRYDFAAGRFENFPYVESLATTYAASFQSPDASDRIWRVHPTGGLISFDITDRKYRLYVSAHGIKAAPGDIEVLTDGRVALPYSDRIGIFAPSRLEVDRSAPNVVLTRVLLGNANLANGGDGTAPRIDHAASAASEIVLPHDHDPLTFEFSALHFADPKRNQFAYRLEGLEENWNFVTPPNRRATYTTLPPGRYDFRVKAANPDGIWNEVGLTVDLTVLPPWWRTWWAYLAYVVASVLLVFTIVRTRTRSLRNRAAALESQVAMRTRELVEQKAIVENQARHLSELMETKDRLTTRISHEFRTPLTVILGPLDRLLATAKDPDLHTYLDAAKRNASRLLRLVNQMLGLARLRGGRPESTHPVRVAPVVRQVVASFESLAKERGLELTFESIEDVGVQSTEDALEKITVNLVSNAIKYSPSGARVSVSVATAADAGTITVADTGRGIEPERLPHIFEPFERGHDEAERIPGSGLGLALVHELATAHGGKVEVESEPGRGSTFRVSLPGASVVALDTQELPGSSEEASLEVAALRAARAAPEEVQAGSESGHSVLVIEDNADMRAYLKRVLSERYLLDFAEDGEAGLKRAFATVPDLVVCDIMMPGKDGYEVCHALKADERTSHIPLIMLTALEGHDERMKGLLERADDYLTKPFNEEELKQRIFNLLDLRAMLQRRYSRDLRYDQGSPAGLSARDQKFLEKLSRYVGQRYADPELSLPAMASALAVSERNLQRKLKALVGLSPGEYLRGYRLQRAMERLLAGERPGDVAAAVGFASQAYFSTCFRVQYGFSPSEARERASRH